MALNEFEEYLHSGMFLIDAAKRADQKFVGTDITNRVIEIVQAGEVFLLKFNCPRCKEIVFQKYPLDKCGNCDISLKKIILEVPQRKKQRLLSGSNRKQRFSQKIVKRLFDLHDNCCAYCLKPFHAVVPNIEHIIPLSFGGSNKIDNLVLSCDICNKIAGSLVFPNIYEKQNYILKKKRIGNNS